MGKRKIKGIRISPDFLGHFFKGKIVEIKKSPLPKDAEYLTTHYDWQRDEFVLYFRHSNFKEIPIGYKVPIFESAEFLCEYKDKP